MAIRASIPGEASPASEPAITLGWLRRATRELHDRAEASLETPTRHIDAAAYARLLLALLPIYSGIERALASFDEWSRLDPPVDVASRRRSPLLLADLRTLDVDVRECRVNDAPAPRLEVFGHALGALYVVEGSRLGGRVLAARIARGSASIGADAFRFLRSDGHDVGSAWSDLRTALAGYATDPSRRAPVVAGAAATFASFELQLARWAS